MPEVRSESEAVVTIWRLTDSDWACRREFYSERPGISVVAWKTTLSRDLRRQSTLERCVRVFEDVGRTYFSWRHRTRREGV